MKTQNPCYDLKMKLVSGRLILAQDISTVVGNMERERVDALPRLNMFRKELEFPPTLKLNKFLQQGPCLAPHVQVLPLV